jgi:hypothetical protein
MNRQLLLLEDQKSPTPCYQRRATNAYIPQYASRHASLGFSLFRHQFTRLHFACSSGFDLHLLTYIPGVFRKTGRRFIRQRGSRMCMIDLDTPLPSFLSFSLLFFFRVLFSGQATKRLCACPPPLPGFCNSIFRHTVARLSWKREVWCGVLAFERLVWGRGDAPLLCGEWR